jgi:RNA polymerase sigma-70 factor (ECF subfamily)
LSPSTRRAALNVTAEASFDERACVAAARGGDVRAFNRLIELYQRLAYNVAYRTLGQAEEAADVTQEALLSAFRGVSDFRGESFKAWLLRIVVNACYDQLRRQQRRPVQSLEALMENNSRSRERLDASPGPERAALSGETAEAVQAALARLAPEHRSIVVLCDVQGLSYEEAAAVLEIAVGTVKSRLSRARAHLRDDLRARGELPGAVERPSHEGLATS